VCVWESELEPGAEEEGKLIATAVTKARAGQVMDKDGLITLFRDINVWKRGSERAPHKPLLLLYALGKCNRGQPRMVPFAEVDEALRDLLREFGPARKSYHPEYPFWFLQSDGLWELSSAEDLKPRTGGENPSRSEFLEHDVEGGFPEPVFHLLWEDSQLLAQVTQDILDRSFPSSTHEDLLQAVGVDLSWGGLTKRQRDPRFRTAVLTAYEYRCAVCGFDVRLEDTQLGVEAAHIKWRQAGGPDVVPNGLALCTLHHKMFDRGVFTVSPGFQMQVSERAHGTSGFEEWLLSFHGKRIREPLRPDYYPKPEFLRWHFKEVFRAPGRYVEGNAQWNPTPSLGA
jgi:putative restriction endonuclease